MSFVSAERAWGSDVKRNRGGFRVYVRNLRVLSRATIIFLALEKSLKLIKSIGWRDGTAIALSLVSMLISMEKSNGWFCTDWKWGAATCK